MRPQNHSSGSTDEQLSIIGTLITQPFLEEKGRTETEHGWGGAGFHITVLRATQDFWGDVAPGESESALVELMANLTAVADVLTERWGDPTIADLWPYPEFDDPDYLTIEQELEPAPEPLATLYGYAFSMSAWRIPSTSRWFGLAIGQGDTEFPYELLAVVGEESSFPQ